MDSRPNIGRMISAMVICLGIFYGWQLYLQKKYPHIINKETQTISDTSKDIHNGGSASSVAQEPPKVLPPKAPQFVQANPDFPEEQIVFEDEVQRVVLSNKGAKIVALRLKKYLGGPNNDPVEMVPPQAPGHLVAEVFTEQGELGFSAAGFKVVNKSGNSVTFEASRNGVNLTKTFTHEPSKYLMKAALKLSGNLGSVKTVQLSSVGRIPPPQNWLADLSASHDSGLHYQEMFFSYGGGKSSRVHVSPHSNGNQAVTSISDKFEQGHWAANGSRYFTSVLYNRSDILPVMQGFDHGDYSSIVLTYPNLQSQEFQMVADFFSGPKSLNLLSAIDASVAGLVDYGMFSVIAHPMLKLMNWFYSIFHNYGVAIILLTILVRMVTFPFNYYSYKSMKSMQRIQPELARLKEIYKDDSQKMNLEVMKLMRDNKVNPLGGCLPVLLQLPIFFALFAVLQNSIELYRVPFAFWIHDLSVRDPYFVLPVLMGLTMFIQQKITPSTLDPTQQKIMLVMPIIFSVFMLGLPSGLTLYIFISTLFGIAQQMYFMRDDEGVKQAVVRRA